MTEWHRNIDVHTFAFHEHRERAPHLEQGSHSARLHATARIVADLGGTVSDLGCGDGGLLQLLKTMGLRAWGYDFGPANIAGWAERGVSAESVDVFNTEVFPDNVRLGDIVVMTEVLEHVADPHGIVRALAVVRERPKYVVASSPRFETHHMDECHQWAWDMQGYYDLFAKNGWTVKSHTPCDWSQILVAS